MRLGQRTCAASTIASSPGCVLAASHTGRPAAARAAAPAPPRRPARRGGEFQVRRHGHPVARQARAAARHPPRTAPDARRSRRAAPVATPRIRRQRAKLRSDIRAFSSITGTRRAGRRPADWATARSPRTPPRPVANDRETARPSAGTSSGTKRCSTRRSSPSSGRRRASSRAEVRCRWSAARSRRAPARPTPSAPAGSTPSRRRLPRAARAAFRQAGAWGRSPAAPAAARRSPCPGAPWREAASADRARRSSPRRPRAAGTHRGEELGWAPVMAGPVARAPGRRKAARRAYRVCWIALGSSARPASARKSRARSRLRAPSGCRPRPGPWRRASRRSSRTASRRWRIRVRSRPRPPRGRPCQPHVGHGVAHAAARLVGQLLGEVADHLGRGERAQRVEILRAPRRLDGLQILLERLVVRRADGDRRPGCGRAGIPLPPPPIGPPLMDVGRGPAPGGARSCRHRRSSAARRGSAGPASAPPSRSGRFAAGSRRSRRAAAHAAEETVAEQQPADAGADQPAEQARHEGRALAA